MAKIRKCLPWVFNGWSLPRRIEIDKGLYGRSVCGIQVTWTTTSDQTLEICRISEKRLSGTTELDLHVDLWVKREVIEKIAPSLLGSCVINFDQLPESKREAGMKSIGPREQQLFTKPLRRSRRIQARSSRKQKTSAT